jgi:hypothetical protein
MSNPSPAAPPRSIISELGSGTAVPTVMLSNRTPSPGFVCKSVTVSKGFEVVTPK